MSETGLVGKEGDHASLVDGIWNSLENLEDRHLTDAIRKQKQLEILKRLPQDFEMEMRAFASHIELVVQQPLEIQIAGEVFENLVRADAGICDKEETKEAELLRSLMKDPDIYGLQKQGIDKSIKNPDIAIINEEGQITGAVEVKAGRINYRGSSQLGNFKDNLNKVVEELEKIDAETLENHGLGVIAHGISKLKVADDFKVTLAVPHGSYKDTDDLIKKEDFNADWKIDVARKRLQNCKIVESPFSRKEIRTINSYILDWLQKK